MSMKRSWAIIMILSVIAVLIVFFDVLPTYRNLKKLSVLKDELVNLKKVTDVYKKAVNRLKNYDEMLNEYAVNTDELNSIFSKFGLVHKKSGNIFSFEGYIDEDGFKEIMGVISKSTNLLLLDMKAYNMQEIPIVFGKAKVFISVSGKIKILSTSFER